MARATWSVDRRTFGGRVTEDGTLVASIPVSDAGMLAGTLEVTLTDDRHLEVVWRVEPDAVSPVDFRAWQKG